MAQVKEYLTFDDVLLKPQVSNILPNDVDISTNLTKDINLNAIKLLKERYPYRIAYGSHSKNHNIIFTSIAYEPSDIFIYVHGNKNTKHPDQTHSIRTELMGEYVKNINECYDKMNEVIKMRLPDLGEGIDFATISEIGVAVGQTIKHDDIILVLESDKPVLVDFWATWCGPCRIIGPIVDELHAELEGKAVIGKVNVDENSEASANYGVRNIPTILIFKNGEVVDKLVGAVPKSEILSKLESYM